MKNISSPLLAHLQAGGPFIMADLYTVTLKSGTVLRWADFDQDIIHPNGNTYSSTGPVLRRGKTRTVIGAEVATLDVSIFARASDLVDGVSLFPAAQAGAFDGATLVLDRAFLSPSMSVIGIVNLSTGRWSDVNLGRTEKKVRVNSPTESLGIPMPRNIYQAGCIHTLYNTAGCGLDRNAFAVGSTVAAGSTAALIKTVLSKQDGYFERGYIKFITGNLAGVEMTVKSYIAGHFGLFMALPAVPAVGDTFIAYAGCDKRQSTCESVKFLNRANFRGCPYIPVPSTAF